MNQMDSIVYVWVKDGNDVVAFRNKFDAEASPLRTGCTLEKRVEDLEQIREAALAKLSPVERLSLIKLPTLNRNLEPRVPVAWEFHFNNGVVKLERSFKKAAEIRKNLDADEYEVVMYD